MLRNETHIWYDWSYILAWISVGFSLASSTLFFSAANCLRSERDSEKANNVQYIMPGTESKWRSINIMLAWMPCPSQLPAGLRALFWGYRSQLICLSPKVSQPPLEWAHFLSRKGNQINLKNTNWVHVLRTGRGNLWSIVLILILIPLTIIPKANTNCDYRT